MPTKIPERKESQVVYNCSDAILLAINSGLKLYEHTGDLEVCKAAVKALKRAIKGFRKNDRYEENGKPVLLEDEFHLSVASFVTSKVVLWVDSTFSCPCAEKATVTESMPDNMLFLHIMKLCLFKNFYGINLSVTV